MPYTILAMRDLLNPKVAKWPFLAGDLLLLGTAAVLCQQAARPLAFWDALLLAGCVAAGALIGIIPFVLEYRAMTRVAEAAALTTVFDQIKNLEKIASQISGATGCWQNAQDAADKTAAAAKAMADRMSEELKAFTEFMQRANDAERANLRLEVEKLHRAETDWLQAIIRMLDHVYALHSGAVRSGQPNLIEQLTNFQNACRDAARRIGLHPFTAAAAESFDPQRHQLLEGNGEQPATGQVAETVAAGYTFQGRMLRPALVRLQPPGDQNANGPEPNGTLEKPAADAQP